MNPLEKEYDLTGKLVRTKSGDLGIRIFFAKMLEPQLRRLMKENEDGKMEGVELDIRIKPLKHKRSDSQNKYFWAVCIPLIQSWLYETQGEKHNSDQVYTWIRQKLLGNTPKVVSFMGDDVIVFEDKHFSKMNTKEFAETVDKIRHEMELRGLMIPEPTKNNHLHEHVSR